MRGDMLVKLAGRDSVRAHGARVERKRHRGSRRSGKRSMSGPLRPTGFSLVHLTLLDVGPLRGTTAINMVDETNTPANLFMIMGPNGGGKTTILEAIHQAMSLLGERAPPAYRLEALKRLRRRDPARRAR